MGFVLPPATRKCETRRILGALSPKNHPCSHPDKRPLDPSVAVWESPYVKHLTEGVRTCLEGYFDARHSVFIQATCLFEGHMFVWGTLGGLVMMWGGEIEERGGAQPPAKTAGWSCLSVGMRWAPRKAYSSQQVSRDSSTPLQASESCPNLTRAIFYMVPGRPPNSSFRKNCPGRWKAEGIYTATSPVGTTFRPPGWKKRPWARLPRPLFPTGLLLRVSAELLCSLWAPFMRPQRTTSRPPDSALRPDTRQQFPETPRATQPLCLSSSKCDLIKDKNHSLFMMS